jgi:hypothetical protein
VNASERDSILTRLWGYAPLLPSGLANLYAQQAEPGREQTALWIRFLGDLVDRRLGDEVVRRHYVEMFPDQAAAHAAMAALQAAWSSNRMDLLRELIERDVRALQAAGGGSSLVPADSPAGSGREGAAVGLEPPMNTDGHG